jgi:hypothetical protein
MMIESTYSQQNKMLKQLQHKRFTIMPGGRQMRNDKLSSPICHWYVQAGKSIEPTGNLNDSIHKRPSYIPTGI